MKRHLKCALVLMLLSSNISVFGQTFDELSAQWEKLWHNARVPNWRAQVAQVLAGYKKLAEAGDYRAQATLGWMYENGADVPQSDALAVKWYRLSAEKGDTRGQSRLGYFYKMGIGVAKDPSLSEQWYRKAADQGNTLALFEMGLVTLMKIRNNQAEAENSFVWFALAANRGHEESNKWRDDMQELLTPQQLMSAQSSIREWRPKMSTPPNVTGSGFVASHGVVVTNQHVVEKCQSIRVNGEDATLTKVDAVNDIALISVVLNVGKVNFRNQPTKVGEPIAVAGFPLHGLLSGFNLTNGNISSLSGVAGKPGLFQISAPVQLGNSGGPVMDSSGNLVGIVVSKLNAAKTFGQTGDIPQNVNFAISLSTLKTFLDANGIIYSKVNSVKVLPNTAIAENALRFTVLVECWQ